jgi:hypothetical protein
MRPDSPRGLRNVLRAGWCLALSLWLLPSAGGATEPVVSVADPASLSAKPRIGRIFFSPAQRRSHRTSGLDTTPRSSPNSRTASSGRQVVNGALSSNSEGRAVWINGATVENSSAHKVAWTDRSGRVWLNQGGQGTRLIKPGQSIDRSGAITDLLPAGSVTRH